MKDILKIVKSLDYSGLLMKSDTETIKVKQKNQEAGIFGYLLH